MKHDNAVALVESYGGTVVRDIYGTYVVRLRDWNARWRVGVRSGFLRDFYYWQDSWTNRVGSLTVADFLSKATVTAMSLSTELIVRLLIHRFGQTKLEIVRTVEGRTTTRIVTLAGEANRRGLDVLKGKEPLGEFLDWGADTLGLDYEAS